MRFQLGIISDPKLCAAIATTEIQQSAADRSSGRSFLALLRRELAIALGITVEKDVLVETIEACGSHRDFAVDHPANLMALSLPSSSTLSSSTLPAAAFTSSPQATMLPVPAVNRTVMCALARAGALRQMRLLFTFVVRLPAETDTNAALSSLKSLLISAPQRVSLAAGGVEPVLAEQQDAVQFYCYPNNNASTAAAPVSLANSRSFAAAALTTLFTIARVPTDTSLVGIGVDQAVMSQTRESSFLVVPQTAPAADAAPVESSGPPPGLWVVVAIIVVPVASVGICWMTLAWRNGCRNGTARMHTLAVASVNRVVVYCSKRMTTTTKTRFPASTSSSVHTQLSPLYAIKQQAARPVPVLRFPAATTVTSAGATAGQLPPSGTSSQQSSPAADAAASLDREPVRASSPPRLNIAGRSPSSSSLNSASNTPRRIVWAAARLPGMRSAYLQQQLKQQHQQQEKERQQQQQLQHQSSQRHLQEVRQLAATYKRRRGSLERDLRIVIAEQQQPTTAAQPAVHSPSPQPGGQSSPSASSSGFARTAREKSPRSPPPFYTLVSPRGLQPPPVPTLSSPTSPRPPPPTVLNPLKPSNNGSRARRRANGTSSGETAVVRIGGGYRIGPPRTDNTTPNTTASSPPPQSLAPPQAPSRSGGARLLLSTPRWKNFSSMARTNSASSIRSSSNDNDDSNNDNNNGGTSRDGGDDGNIDKLVQPPSRHPGITTTTTTAVVAQRSLPRRPVLLNPLSPTSSFFSLLTSPPPTSASALTRQASSASGFAFGASVPSPPPPPLSLSTPTSTSPSNPSSRRSSASSSRQRSPSSVARTLAGRRAGSSNNLLGTAPVSQQEPEPSSPRPTVIVDGAGDEGAPAAAAATNRSAIMHGDNNTAASLISARTEATSSNNNRARVVVGDDSPRTTVLPRQEQRGVVALPPLPVGTSVRN
jgi:hypothetical protein